MSRTKIVATIGPITNSTQMISQLVEAGMDVARLNGAHADLDWHSQTIDLLRQVAPQIPILLDLPGSKVRTGQLEQDVSFEVGDKVTFTTSSNGSGPNRVPVDADAMHKAVAEGDVLSADDGAISFTVLEIVDQDVICRADTTGILRSRKGISLPSAVKKDVVTARDMQIIEFATQKDVDFVGVSFVSSAAHVQSVRDLTEPNGPRIVAKIENQEGLDHLRAIAEAADALLVDRGDLSVQTSLETIVLAQKHILSVARAVAKPVIIATEMMHTMIENPMPTKAEVCDISNAVLDGASAVMLSGETAVGKYPSQAVALMKSIAAAATAHQQKEFDAASQNSSGAIPPAMAEALSLLCRRLPVSKIVAITINGYAARMAAASRPRQPILAVSNNAAAARSFNLLPGTEGIFVDIPYVRTSTDHIAKCLEELWRRNKITDDDLVLVTSLGYPGPGNRMNMIQTHKIADLRQALQWAR